MHGHKSDKHVPAPKHVPVPWSVPVTVDDVPEETARHFKLSADAGTRAAVAKVAALRDLPRLEATFEVTRRGSKALHVVGKVSATVGQNCVATLEPLSNEVEENVDLVFAPPSPMVQQQAVDDDDEGAPKRGRRNLDGPEALIDGAVDLGALATEFLILGLDPYPRKDGAVFKPPQDIEPDPGPFAALAGLVGKERDGH
jgi:Large ribosomal RNA subunit accumulation protein YceD